MNFFDEATLRLKQQLKVTEDKQAAEALGLTGNAWTMRKRRSAFPEKELRALAQQRPELGLDVDYVLTGGQLTQRERGQLESARALTLQLPMDEVEKQRLLALINYGFLQQATQNAARQQDYEKLIAALNTCSDESLRLVLLVTEKCRLADQVASRKRAA